MKMKQQEHNWINTNQAIQIIRGHDISCTRTSLLTWIGKYCLGKKVGGRWYIDKERLYEFLKGEINAN